LRPDEGTGLLTDDVDLGVNFSLEQPHWQLSLTELGHLSSELVFAHETELVNPIRSKRYQAPGQTAFLIYKGELNVETDAGSVSVGPGNWCLPHQGPRLLRMEPGGHVVVIRFRLYWPGGEPLFNAPVATVFKAAFAPRLEKQGRVLVRTITRAMPGAKAEMPWRKTDLLTYFRFQRAFDAWLYVYVDTMLRLGAVPSRLAKTDPRVLKVVAQLDELPLDHTLVEAELLEECGLSSSQLNRLFSREFKMTPHQYFEARKLTRAKTLIRSSPMAIKQIAYETGFGSLPAFSRWFKQQTGQSPRDFKHNEQV